MTKYLTEDIEKKVEAAILEEGGWIGKAEIAKRIGIPRNSILSRGVDTDDISLKLGFPRPYLKPKGTAISRNSVIKPLIDKYKEMIISAGRPVTLYELGDALGLDTISKKSRLYRYGINWEEIHKECGIPWHLNKKMPSLSEAERILRQLISDKNRYVTRDELADTLKVSGSSLSYHKLRVDDINWDYGYVADGRGYELRILELLKVIFPNATFQTQKTFEDCRTSKDTRSKLRFDFYSPELNCLFEIDGPQHYDPAHFWYDESLLKRDSIKNEYAKSNNIELIRIRYDSKITIESLKHLLSGTPLKHGVGQSAAEPEK